ncbi:MAG TPA: bifunctional UDP-N-acetylglucosamine diphosphorylase/glucosamine-1-phosphate N-acetyltransferase GlmU [Thermomicrobiales bacterium]|nr:bifunctional UDP-N-acetylglucosamine diphosphorylase/glucosamine-1-phosphate N-acetyltransferase GlmU [Thermomicrobiales bacterium]
MSEQPHEELEAASETTQSDVVVAVLAAGHGTRMRSSIPKHLHPVAGVPIVERVVRAGVGAGAGRTLVMVGSNLADLEDRIGSSGQFEIVVQGPPRGTADSVRIALEHSPEARWMVSLLGDGALLTPDVVRSLIQQAKSTGSRITLLTCKVPDAATYGRIERDEQGRVRRIVEYKNDSDEKRRGVTEINSGVMVLDAEWARVELGRLPLDETTGEYLLTDLVDVAVRQAGDEWPVDAYIADESIALAVNDRVQLAEVDDYARRLIRERHMRAGVTIIGPNTVFIDEDVEIGPDTVIHPHTILRGRTVIGRECEIGPSSMVVDSTIGDGVMVMQSTVRNSSIGDGSDVGPFAHLRAGCRIGADVHIGSYAEMKNATLGDGAKCGHVSYLGDVTVGAASNIGAGTITANFDGAGKHPTTIGEGAFVGSDSVLVAPVSIGNRARTGAGAVVTRDVPDDTLVVGVPARPARPVTTPAATPDGSSEE